METTAGGSAGTSQPRVSIVGGSGYTGGELVRLLLDHPHVQLAQVTSERNAGRFLHGTHPNLRSRTTLKFCSREELQPCDLLFLALPHGEAAASFDSYRNLAPKIVDLSADFRLADPATYQTWYGSPHPAPGVLGGFAYGLPELNRAKILASPWISGVGCNATATNLAIAPLARQQWIRSVVVDLKVGSSEAGATPTASSHHPVRSGAVRSYAPVGHRHQAEVQQLLGPLDLHFSVTAIEMVRGVLCTAHVFPNRPVTEKDIWKLYREAYRDEPFVRLVNDRTGLYRYPEPRIVAGTNYCDVGFAVDEASGRIVVISAIDNLMKGAAGTAVQCLNLICGFPETTALTFAGLHP